MVWAGSSLYCVHYILIWLQWLLFHLILPIFCLLFLILHLFHLSILSLQYYILCLSILSVLKCLSVFIKVFHSLCLPLFSLLYCTSAPFFHSQSTVYYSRYFPFPLYSIFHLSHPFCASSPQTTAFSYLPFFSATPFWVYVFFPTTSFFHPLHTFRCWKILSLNFYFIICYICL
jgi:hypothetical protein